MTIITSSPHCVSSPADEHHALQPACEHIPVTVYDQEPSSIIAYALSCVDYHNKLQELRLQAARDVRDRYVTTRLDIYYS